MLLFHHKYLKAYKENNSFHFFFVVNTYRQGCKHDRMGKMEKTGGFMKTVSCPHDLFNPSSSFVK